MRGDSVLNAAVFEVFEAAGVPAASRDDAIELAVLVLWLVKSPEPEHRLLQTSLRIVHRVHPHGRTLRNLFRPTWRAPPPPRSASL